VGKEGGGMVALCLCAFIVHLLLVLLDWWWLRCGGLVAVFRTQLNIELLSNRDR
jgi:hypothetical protein